MTTIYLVRHAEAEGNLYRRIHGWYDSLITDNGFRQIQALEARFRDILFGEAGIPVLFNCLGREKGPEDSIPALLVRQVQSSVYMEDSIRCMADMGLDAIVEIGPGKALSGFVKKTVPGFPVHAVETTADVEALEQLIKENG